MHKIPVIIDTDPGIDDLLALAIALASESLDVRALSISYGNVSLEHTIKNALLICDILEYDVPVIKGSKKPLFYNKKESSTVHGPDGLGNLRSKYRDEIENHAQSQDGVYHLYRMLKESPEPLTIIALGPLTNIATLLLFDTDIKDQIKEIYVMGGGLKKGNINDLAEFNFFSDSYAADIVLSSEIPITMSTLDVTSKVYFTQKELETFNPKSLKMKFIKESIDYYAAFDPYMHDVVAVLSLTHPELFEYNAINMKVHCGIKEADGMSYVCTEETKHIQIVDTDKREELIKVIFKSLEEAYHD